MLELLPGRGAARGRLMAGAGAVAGISLLHLTPVSLGSLGAPWPLALLWAAHGWASLGPSAGVAALLFALGLWLDVLTGGPLGAWALVALVAHAAAFLSGGEVEGSAGWFGMGLTCAAAVAAIAGLSLAQGSPLGIVAAVVPCCVALALFPVAGQFYHFDMDDV